MKLRTRIAVATATALTAAGAAACGGGNSQPISYAPAAYGANGQCYYVDDATEAVSLMAAGLCPPTWVPTPMPLAWHEMYYNYYASPAYVVYVPANRRSYYTTSQVTFQKTYSVQINTASRNATWKGSNGKTVPGSAVNPGKMSFGGGNARPAPTLGGAPRTTAPAPGFGGGNARTSAPRTVVKPSR